MALAPISPEYAVVLVVSAFTLPLLFMWWIRNTKRIGRQPMGKVVKAFAWGAVFSVIIALILSLLLQGALEQVDPLYLFLSRRFAYPSDVLAVLVVAPVVEEAAKALGARAGQPAVRVKVDGIVFGAAAGLGFSATENLFYGLAHPGEALLVIAIRSFSSSFLHASATGVTGYGLAAGWLSDRTWAFLPYYLLAVLMHATFNALASFGELYSTQYGDLGTYVGFAAAVLFAVAAVTVVRYKLASRPLTVTG